MFQKKDLISHYLATLKGYSFASSGRDAAPPFPGDQYLTTRRWTRDNISVARIYQIIIMDNKQPTCKTGNINCLSTMKCKCATTQQWVASTSGPKKNKNIEKNQHVNSCARCEAGVLELYESRIQQQNKRERLRCIN